MTEELSEHAEERIRQRGLRKKDVDFVLQHGSAGEDAVMLTNKDVERSIANFRRCISDLERLRGTAVFVRGGTVVSVYKPRRKKMRRIMRGESARFRQGAR